MHKAKTIAIALAVAFALNACGNGGPSANASSSTSLADSDTFRVSASQSLTASKSISGSTQIPAPALFQDAMREVNWATGLGPYIADYMQNVMLGGQVPVTYSGARWAGMEVKEGTISDTHRATATTQRKLIAGYLGKRSPAADVPLKHLKRCTDFVLDAADYKPARACYSEYYAHVFASAAVLASYFPQTSPLVGGSHNPMNMARTYNPEIYTWAAGAMALVDVATYVQNRIAKRFEAHVLSNPAAATEAIALALFELPLEPMYKLITVQSAAAEVVLGFPPVKYQQVIDADQITVQADPGSAGMPIAISLPSHNRHIAQMQGGLVETRSGLPYYGQGYIAGQQLTFNISDTRSATMSESSSTDQSVSGSRGLTSGTSTGVSAQ